MFKCFFTGLLAISCALPSAAQKRNVFLETGPVIGSSANTTIRHDIPYTTRTTLCFIPYLNINWVKEGRKFNPSVGIREYVLGYYINEQTYSGFQNGVALYFGIMPGIHFTQPLGHVFALRLGVYAGLMIGQDIYYDYKLDEAIKQIRFGAEGTADIMILHRIALGVGYLHGFFGYDPMHREAPSPRNAYRLQYPTAHLSFQLGSRHAGPHWMHRY